MVLNKISFVEGVIQPKKDLFW